MPTLWRNDRVHGKGVFGGCEDEHIDVTVPERLLILVPGFRLLVTSPEMVDYLKHTAYQA